MNAINEAQAARMNLPAYTDVVNRVVFTCLKEFAVSLIVGVTVATFIPATAGVAVIMTASAVQLAVSALFHSLAGFAFYKVAQKGPYAAQFEIILSGCEWITGSNFALLTGFNLQVLIHEVGHYLAALLSYKNPQPKIQIQPFLGGITQFYKTALSGWGKKIGPVATTCFVIASGPAFTLLVSSIVFTIGLAMRQTYPHFSKYLVSYAALDFLNHAKYAYSALETNSSSFAHDFAHLAVFGLDPIVATVAILAIPIVIALGVTLSQSQQQVH